ncbi:MAG: bifunctional UDP-3-O-[3-hydroxymyristoyl] N-acetylglucosamine deacetylase/3-hydroxyacyl-ACP dehydratase [Candidatus Omnitrophica bacterium]|nr:bifunctional UDP-3-O-[3-hydroxymyristoyl] N-acetylglucosamine deacetylase/3-hydroxyacyl-ACP dehydratase [Candidatus Omnitrophota bacterium]
MEPQHTIQREIKLEGIGIHTGKPVRVILKPAPVNSGIRFIRIDLPDRPSINCDISNVIDVSRRPRRTSIGNGNIEIHTIEHLLAALIGLGIDNIIVELDAEELPGLDGSAIGFVEALKTGGRKEQEGTKRIFAVREPLWAEEQGALLAIFPSDELKISYTLSYEHPFLKTQFMNYVLNTDSFEKEIAPSRTFCMESEAEELRNKGLGKGADYNNTVVVGKNGIINNDLRFENEFVRHKILDLIGDLNLLSFFVKGHIIGFRSGHSINLKLIHKIKSLREHQTEGGIPAVHVEPNLGELDANAIQRILPHRYPFLFVDKIIELVEDKRAVGIKNVTINDYFFKGHFPGRPIMPGVLIVEALAQVAGVLMLNKRENLGKYAYFMSIDNVKFRKTVVPGDELRLEAEIARLKSRMGQVKTRALVEGKVVAEADLVFTLVEP